MSQIKIHISEMENGKRISEKFWDIGDCSKEML